jgi:hypothetical protein
MKIERFRQILAAYGTREAQWPIDERNEALELVQTDAKCAQLLEAHRELDDVLDGYIPLSATIFVEHILERLPKPITDRLVNWLLPKARRDIWKPATASVLPLVLGILIGSSTLLDSLSLVDDTLAIDWDEEIYLLALDDNGHSNELLEDSTDE